MMNNRVLHFSNSPLSNPRPPISSNPIFYSLNTNTYLWPGGSYISKIDWMYNRARDIQSSKIMSKISYSATSATDCKKLGGKSKVICRCQITNDAFAKDEFYTSNQASRPRPADYAPKICWLHFLSIYLCECGFLCLAYHEFDMMFNLTFAVHYLSSDQSLNESWPKNNSKLNE